MAKTILKKTFHLFLKSFVAYGSGGADGKYGSALCQATLHCRRSIAYAADAGAGKGGTEGTHRQEMYGKECVENAGTVVTLR
jgi:hypothetical protein